MGTAYRLAGVQIGSTEIGGITRQSVPPNVQTLIQGGSGSTQPTWGGIMSIAPVISFTSVHVAAVLNAIPLLTGQTTGTLRLAFQDVVASTYVTIQPYVWLAVIRQISASQGREATVDVDIHAFGDASNHPLSIGTSSLALTRVVSEKFTIGKVLLNGGTYLTQNITINPDVQVGALSDSGNLWPTAGYVRQVGNPMVSFTTFDLDKSRSIITGGNSGLTLTSMTAYLRKKVEGGAGNVANATAQHIAFTGTTGVATFTDMSGDHGTEGMLSVDCHMTNDGTNDCILVSTGSACS